LTVAHVLNDVMLLNQHQKERLQYERNVAQINADGKFTPKQKRKHIARLGRNDQWITNQSMFWGFPGTRINQFKVDTEADLATGKLEPFEKSWVKAYPVFKNPSEEMLPGTSLCRLGFPFHEITATFNQDNDTFNLSPSVLPMPFFPNDGIHTRVAVMVTPNGRQVKFIETSSPGLLGQSGGPIFDINGNVWAIQTRTMHLPLGFSPKIKEGNREITEHQFMHVGWGTHVEEIIKFLGANGVKYQLSNTQPTQTQN
jgi:hypothetical protein